MDDGRIYSYGFCYAPKQWRFDRYKHTDRLYYIHGGSGGCCYQGKNYTFAAGNLYFIPYHENLVLYSDASDPILHTFADLELIPPILSREVLCAVPQGDALLDLALQIFCTGGKRQSELHLPGDPYRFLSETPQDRICFSAILLLIDFVLRVNHVSVIRDPVVIEALTSIHRSIREPLSVTQLAANAYMSTDSFIRRFKKAVGSTPYAYQKQLRLRTAVYLRECGMSLSEIAANTGYSDASALLHAFKRT